MPLFKNGKTYSPPRTATKVVAASDADYSSKLFADYVCDGTADDVQIQAAIDALSATYGGKIQLTDGTYQITDIVTLADNIEMCGIGSHSALLELYFDPSATKTAILYLPNGSGNVYIHDIGFDGRYSSVTADEWWEHCAIQTQHAYTNPNTNIVVERCYIHDFERGVSYYYAQNCKIINCEFVDNRGESINIDHADFAGGSTTVDSVPHSNIISGNIVSGSNTGYACYVDHYNAGNGKCIITENIFNAGKLQIEGTEIIYSENIYDSNNDAYFQGYNHTITNSKFIMHDEAVYFQCIESLISHCEIAGYIPLAIQGSYTHFTNNLVVGYKTLALSGNSVGVVIENCTIDGTYASGVCILGPCTNAIVRNNTIRATYTSTTLAANASENDTCVRLTSLSEAAIGKYIKIQKDDASWHETYIKEILVQDGGSGDWVILETALAGDDAASGNTVVVGQSGCNGIYQYDTVVDTVIEGNDLRDVGGTAIAGPGISKITRDNIGSVASGDVVTISKVIDHADLTDNEDATAYIDFDDAIPAGSIVKAVKCDFTEAWNSDDTTTVTMMIGYTGDLDAFNKTADPGENAFNHTTDVYWGESDCQEPVVSAEKTPRVTFTEDDDGTDLISSANAQGGVTITITYMKC